MLQNMAETEGQSTERMGKRMPALVRPGVLPGCLLAVEVFE